MISVDCNPMPVVIMSNFQFSIGKILFSLVGWYVFLLFLYDNYVKNLSYNLYQHLIFIGLFLSISVIICIFEEIKEHKININKWLKIFFIIGIIFTFVLIIGFVTYVFLSVFTTN